MCGFEFGQLLRIKTVARQNSPAMMPEHSLEEISAPVGFFEPTILGHRELGPPPHEHIGKDTDARSRRLFVLAKDLDPLHPAARGSSFENEAVEAGPLELHDLFAGEALHPLGEVLARFHLDQPRVVATGDEPDRRPWHAEPELDLGAHRHPLEPPSNHIREIAIVPVTAVVSDRGTKQA